MFTGHSSKKYTRALAFGVLGKFVRAHACCDSGYGQAYFGNGTKLTVLERDVKEPEVEILKPSGIETRCKKTITLVCVAEKFYPDHVSITWTLGDKEIKENVATDPYATQDKTTKLFSMTSRLKVSKKEFKPKNKYRCTVNFYNGTHDISDNTDEINGIEGSEYEPEDYVKSAQWMKLAYSVFIAKSGLYGLVVLVYVMRKGSSGKRMN
ncbi:T cell receptor beta chain MC.7.G5-like isoform X1 [Cyprinus carpio]|uniref:T cell receptor beta chain MC.7.G5-like isoform X1 n=1 Tax=Cyprinus carpio TaxID=7962 RepID=UPI001C58995B|nr:T cell receptor beta chain MC.7.G5-like isoform X1 [Cyprinus carpio]